jgi:hypothetical protein
MSHREASKRSKSAQHQAPFDKEGDLRHQLL